MIAGSAVASLRSRSMSTRRLLAVIAAAASSRRGRTGLGLAMFSILIGLLLPMMSAHESRYDTRVPVPSGRETYAEVTPVTVAGIERDFESWPGRHANIHGARVRYGDVARIDIARLPSPEVLDQFVRAEIEPRLQGYSRQDSDRGPSGWRLRGSNAHGARLYGWQNQDWLFVIEAISQPVFDEVVDKFTYIRRR